MAEVGCMLGYVAQKVFLFSSQQHNLPSALCELEAIQLD
jgi:hypothetical protein